MTPCWTSPTRGASTWSSATGRASITASSRASTSSPCCGATGTEVWLPGYGLVKVFKIVAPDGDIAYWASSDLTLTDLTRQQYAEYSWAIENYHRGIKQCTEVEGCQARSEQAQRNHIALAL